MSESLVIGSRGSDLALWQANHVKMQLQDLGFNSSIKIIKTKYFSFNLLVIISNFLRRLAVLTIEPLTH